MEGPLMLPMLVLVPLIGAAVTLFLGGERSKYVRIAAFAFGIVPLAMCVPILMSGDMSEYDFSAEWISAANLRMGIDLTVDGLSVLMVLLTAFLVPVVIAFSYKESDRPNYFYTLLLAIEVGLMGVYLSADYFLFYVMWEVSLIPMYFLISWYGGPRRHYSAIKFFIYTHVASLVMLIGIFALAFEAASIRGTGVVDFGFAAVNAAAPAFGTLFSTLVFGLLFFGFAVKMPAVPFHTWLPDAHTEAPTAGSVLLAGVMLKMGSYGIIRVCMENFGTNPDVVDVWQPIMLFMGLLAMVYGAYACIAQRDLKKMVAYSSISHMGLVMVAMGCFSETGTEFAVFQMFAHGLISAMLFMVCGAAGHNFGTREIPLLGGMASRVPKYAAFTMFAFMASLGLPGLIGFWGEFGIVYAFTDWAVESDAVYLIVFCLLTLLLTAGYYIWAMQRALFGRLTDRLDFAHVHDLDLVECVSLGAVALLVVIIGFWPDLALHYIGLYPFLGVI